MPDLPKKRFFNTSEQVIEERRTELEKFLKTLLRNAEMRENGAVRYFLTQQEGLEVFLGNGKSYDWAYQALQSLDPKYFSLEMLRAVAQNEYHSISGEFGCMEPEVLLMKLPDDAHALTFAKDLDERL